MVRTVVGDVDGRARGEDGERALQVPGKDRRRDVLCHKTVERRGVARGVGDGEGVRLEGVENGPRVVQQLQLDVSGVRQSGNDMEGADAGNLRGAYGTFRGNSRDETNRNLPVRDRESPGAADTAAAKTNVTKAERTEVENILGRGLSSSC